MTRMLRGGVVLAAFLTAALLFETGCSSTRSGSSSGGGGCSGGCCRSQGPKTASLDQPQEGVPATALGGQKTCPVTGEALGSMGTPVPVTVKGQTVYVCCEGCAAAVNENPDATLAKVAAERNNR